MWLSTLALLLAAAPRAHRPADNSPPRIEHTGLAEVAAGQDLLFEANISDPSGVFEPVLYWRIAGKAEWKTLPLAPLGNDRHVVTLFAAQITGDLEYFLEAYDAEGNGPARVGGPEKPLRVRRAAPRMVAPPEAVGSHQAEPGAGPEVVGGGRRSLVGPAITMGAGALLSVVGLVVYLGASSDASDLDARYPTPGTPLPPADYELAQSAISRGRVGSVLAIVGGVVIAGGGALLLLPPSGGAVLAARIAW